MAFSNVVEYGGFVADVGAVQQPQYFVAYGQNGIASNGASASIMPDRMLYQCVGYPEAHNQQYFDQSHSQSAYDISQISVSVFDDNVNANSTMVNPNVGAGGGGGDGRPARARRNVGALNTCRFPGLLEHSTGSQRSASMVSTRRAGEGRSRRRTGAGASRLNATTNTVTKEGKRREEC